jgi:hypothetical protein
MDRTSEALAVKKTRQPPVRSSSNLTRVSNLGVLSPPREEPGCEDQGTTISRNPTPLRSSLKPPSKVRTNSEKATGPLNPETISPSKKDEVLALQSLYNPSMPAGPPEPTTSGNVATPTIHVATSTIGRDKSTQEARHDILQRRSHSRTPSRIPKPSNQDEVGATPGKNLKPKFSCDLGSMTAYAVVPGAKILSGTSTMRHQPKTSPADSTTKLTNDGSASKLTKRKSEREPNQMERLATISKHIVSSDQMDGAGDTVLTGNLCRGSFRDLKDQFETRNSGANGPSSYHICKSRSKVDLQQDSDAHFQGQKASMITPYKVSPLSAISSHDDLKRVAGKVLGLAAKFDSAAKYSSLVPRERIEAKYRRDGAGLVSPYTSNPSSLHSITSASTPTSLMCRSSRDPMARTSNVDSARKSRIPRPQNVDSCGRTERESGPGTSQAGSGSPRSHSARSILLTPLTSPTKKDISDPASVSLAQVDGSSKDGLWKTPRPALTLASRQEARPVIYYSSPTVSAATHAGKSSLPRLSQNSLKSACSETPSYFQDLSLHNLSSSPSNSLGRGRNASSLRDQIRSLRQELSSKKEECTQLRLEFEENRKASQVSEILLREDLDRAWSDLANWKRRAERAESKVERLELRAQSGGRNHDFSFVSGLPDNIDISERSPQYRPLTARMNQSARRAPENIRPIGPSFLTSSDAVSDCSVSTVVRNAQGADERQLGTMDDMFEVTGPPHMDDLL